MKLVDANVLLYAVDTSAKHHHVAKRWLDRALSGSETVLLPWVCTLAFVRISTHPAIYERPLDVERALDVVAAWLSCPGAVAGEPGLRHVDALREMLEATGAGGNLVNDAHLAAIARERGATVVSFDNDFERFPGVAWQRPA